MVFQWLFNAYYSLNPFKNVRYKGEESLDLPALPDLSQYFQPYSVLGFKQNMDPRFPRNNFDMSKKCFTNFCVWRECLQQHSETLDEDDPNARICRQYKNLAKHTCTANWFKSFMEQVEKDNLVMIMGLNHRRPGSNPTVLHIRAKDRVIMKVINQNAKGHVFKEGEVFDHNHGKPGWDFELEKEWNKNGGH